MKIIGLTGGIASGKSTVSQYLKELGSYIIDADLLARKVVQPGELAYNSIIEHFGRDILLDDNNIDRRRLAQKVFNNPQALKKLNSIIHPQVITETNNLLKAAREAKAKVAVVDAPLLLEAGMAPLADEIWVVAADKDMQIQRALKRDSATKQEIESRIASQMPLEEKKLYAQRIIDNSGTLKETYQQVKKYFQELIRSDNN